MGGAAAAVAAGMTPLELGSDIGGSIPGPPGSLLAQVDIAVVGPIVRGVAHLRTVLGIVAGPLPQDAAGWRLELATGSGLGEVGELGVATVFGEGSDVVPVAADVRANLDSFSAGVAEAGARVEAVALPVPLADGFRSWQDLALPIMGLGLPEAEYAELASLENVPGDPGDGKAMTSRLRSWMRGH